MFINHLYISPSNVEHYRWLNCFWTCSSGPGLMSGRASDRKNFTSIANPKTAMTELQELNLFWANWAYSTTSHFHYGVGKFYSWKIRVAHASNNRYKTKEEKECNKPCIHLWSIKFCYIFNSCSNLKFVSYIFIFW